MRVFLFSYKLKKEISFGESQGENKVYLFDKRNKNVKFAISGYDENLVAFFATLIDGNIYDLDMASEEYKINHRIIDLLIEKKLIKKKFRIIIDLPFLKNLKIKGFRALTNTYLPIFFIGFIMQMKYKYNLFYGPSLYEIIVGIIAGMLVHEIAHVLVANDIKKGIVKNVFLIIFPMSLVTELEPIENLYTDIKITSAGVKSQLFFSGLLNIAAGALYEYVSFECFKFIINISIINLIIAIGNILNVGSSLTTDGYKVIHSIFYRYRNDFNLILEFMALLTKYSLIVIYIMLLYMIVRSIF